MKQKQQSQSSTAKSDGLKPIENSYHYFTVGNSLLGTCQKCVLLEQHLKHLVEELPDPSRLSTYSSLQLMSLSGRLGENYRLLNAMIYAAKSLRSWLSEGLDEPHLSTAQ